MKAIQFIFGFLVAWTIAAILFFSTEFTRAELHFDDGYGPIRKAYVEGWLDGNARGLSESYSVGYDDGYMDGAIASIEQLQHSFAEDDDNLSWQEITEMALLEWTKE